MSSNNNFKKFELYYRKPKNENVLKNLEETHMGLSNCQNFIPLYSTFFSLNGTNYNSINLNHQYSINSIVIETETTRSSNYNNQEDQHSKNFATVTLQQHNQVDEEKEINEIDAATTAATRDSCNYKSDIPVFFKFSPLLDPIKYLAGSYDMQNNSLLNLPSLMSSHLSIDNKNSKNKELEQEQGKEGKEGHNYCHPKILDPNNAAYVDGFFSYLSSQLLHAHDFIHGIDFYGAYLATQKDFTFNMFDDQEYLMKNDFFKDKNGVLFYYDEAECQNVLTWNEDRKGGHKETKSKNSKIQISNENAVEINAEHLEHLETEITDGLNPIAVAFDTELVDLSKSQIFKIHEDINENDDIGINYKKCGDCDSYSSSSSSCSSRSSHTTNGSLYNMSDGETHDDNSSELSGSGSDSYNEGDEEGEESEEGEEDEEEEEEILNAIIYDFPVEVIALERCSKTLDHLMVKDTLSDEEWEAALMQIVLILATYQKLFAFTHNDLHTNNIMYIETDKKFIYYCFNKKYYKVPTFGRIFKIIDFGRSIYTFHSKFICSDSFHRSGDAATQYNCEPYFNDKKPIVEPNYSFDLCRLGCSLFDFFIDDIDNVEAECKKSRLTKLVVDWITDDNGRNILYKKSGVDRYPDFKLYKMIARTVHDKVPSQQLLKHTVFTQYEITQKNIKKSFTVLNIDGIPSYI